ncbi:MAG: antitoxin [Thiohalocapsa sp.]|uniref:antitoxin n=1 Tax=Thiohalocapsa sp. TaxID=2497641 RepID=UPI0025E05909|nr:antitoxin [Thiohalocapsa sp.]MCG6941531.1 antitoxin [Thiohalocapsa sp.]
MNRAFAECATTLEELRRDPAAVLATAGDEALASLDQDRPAAYLISADAFERLLERLDDAELTEVVQQRQPDLDQAVDVTLDGL